MPDYLAYWPNFKQDAARGNRRTLAWFTNHELLSNLIRGDHLWLVISGDSSENPNPNRGFLAEEFVIDRAIPNSGDTPDYPAADFKFALYALPSRTRAFASPIDVDQHIRTNRATNHLHIGTVLQNPRKLPDEFASKFYTATRDAPFCL